jgi:hypothetical protein
METKDTLQLTVAPTEVKRNILRTLPWVFVLLIVTVVYILIMSALICEFESDWSFLHACYFTVTNMTAVDFGDIFPLSHGARIIAGISGFVGLLLFGILVATLTVALQPSGWSATLKGTSNSQLQEPVDE